MKANVPSVKGGGVPPAKADPPFVTITAAAKKSGLSQYYIRAGCRSGSIPCIRVGEKYMIDYQGMIDTLQKAARG